MDVALRLVFLLLVVSLTLTSCYMTYPSSHARGHVVKKHRHLFYIVHRGDTLYSIGRRFGVDYRTLARRNHLSYPYEIFPGQRLSIYSVAPRSTSLPGLRQPPEVHKKHSSPQRRRVADSQRYRLLWPVRGKVTSGFGQLGNRLHDGIDIAAPKGTPVRAAASGTVVYSDSRLSGYGKLIIIRHGRDLFTAYGHNQRNLVHKGDRVRAGDIIARVGQTGRASGPHLHFEVRRGSTPVDPLAYLPSR